MTHVTPEYIHRLAEASRKARCVVGWVSDELGAEAIRVHDFQYTTPTGNARACSRCGEFRHYGPRLMSPEHMAKSVADLRVQVDQLADEVDAIARSRGVGPFRCLKPGCRGGLWREGDVRTCCKCGGEERV